MRTPGFALARAECGDRNTRACFEAASADDARACAGAWTDVDARVEGGWTPLPGGCANDTPEVVMAQVPEAGADPEARTGNDNTPPGLAKNTEKHDRPEGPPAAERRTVQVVVLLSATRHGAVFHPLA